MQQAEERTRRRFYLNILGIKSETTIICLLFLCFLTGWSVATSSYGLLLALLRFFLRSYLSKCLADAVRAGLKLYDLLRNSEDNEESPEVKPETITVETAEV